MRSLIATALVLVLMSPLSASPILAKPAAEPALDQAAQSPGALARFQWSLWSANASGVAQTLTVGQTGVLQAVELFLSRESFTTQDLSIQIRGYGPDGPALAVSAPVPPARIPVSPASGWVRFTFPIPTHVTVGQTVAIVTPLPDPAWADFDPAWFWAWSQEGYATGVAWDGSWRDRASNPVENWESWWDGSDRTFRTFIGETTVTGFTGVWSGVDEDGSSMLLVIGKGERPQMMLTDSYEAGGAGRPTRFTGVGRGYYSEIWLYVTFDRTSCGPVPDDGRPMQLYYSPGGGSGDSLWEDEDGDGIGVTWIRVK